MTKNITRGSIKSTHILALGGGGFSMESDNTLLDDYALSLTGKANPKVCFIPTASGDSVTYIEKFRAAFDRSRCVPTFLSLFQRKHTDVQLAEMIMGQDLIYVGGGNTANMLTLWKLHGVDKLLKRAHRAGTVLCGISAGANCWFQACSTDSFGAFAAMKGGLGIVKGSFCPHYHNEPNRAESFRRFVASEQLPGGYACDDGAGLHIINGKVSHAVASKAGARAYRVVQAKSDLRAPLRAPSRAQSKELIIEPRLLKR
jgi:dipeptidase E